MPRPGHQASAGLPATGSTVTSARLAAQLLAGSPATDADSVVQRVLAVQAQDERGFRLAIRARSHGVTAADVDAALTERRSLVLTWLNRGTLHLIRSEDYWWLHPLTAPQHEAAVRRRLEQEQVSTRQVEQGIEMIADQARSSGPRTRSEIRAALDEAGVPTGGQALYLLLCAAAQRGLVVRGPLRDSEHCYVATHTWLGSPPPGLDRGAALTRLARRYLHGHGPAQARDLARWAGIGLREARSGLAGLTGELVEHPGGMLDLADRSPGTPVAGPRLLGAFDPLLHGWTSRQFVLGQHQGIVTTNGVFRPFALVNGRAVATWGLAGGRVTIRPLEPLHGDVQEALLSDALQVLRFLALPPTDPIVVH